jgi:hypothetical protein
MAATRSRSVRCTAVAGTTDKPVRCWGVRAPSACTALLVSVIERVRRAAQLSGAQRSSPARARPPRRSLEPRPHLLPLRPPTAAAAPPPPPRSGHHCGFEPARPRVHPGGGAAVHAEVCGQDDCRQVWRRRYEGPHTQGTVPRCMRCGGCPWHAARHPAYGVRPYACSWGPWSSPVQPLGSCYTRL